MKISKLYNSYINANNNSIIQTVKNARGYIKWGGKFGGKLK